MKEKKGSIDHFYRCLFSDLASEWQRGCRLPCFHQDLTTFGVNQAVLMLTNWHLNEKSREIPSFAFTGQVTKHADSQIPRRARLYYLCISAAICAAFPLGNIVLTFHVPILKYLILERERWFRPVASRCLRLSPLDFILFLTEEASSPK